MVGLLNEREVRNGIETVGEEGLRSWDEGWGLILVLNCVGKGRRWGWFDCFEVIWGVACGWIEG